MSAKAVIGPVTRCSDCGQSISLLHTFAGFCGPCWREMHDVDLHFDQDTDDTEEGEEGLNDD